MSERFRLGVVLRLREMAEDKAQIALGHSVAAHHRALGEVRRFETEAAAERARLADLQLGPAAPAGLLVDAVEAVATAERAVERGRDVLQVAADALLEARRAMADASRRREVVERLRDRFLAEQRRDEERREAAILSDMGVTRHAWRVLGDGPE